MKHPRRPVQFIAVFVVTALLGAQGRTPATPGRHNNLGAAEMSQQRFEAALIEFKAAGNVVNQGIALIALGKLDDAEKALQQVLAADPDNLRAHYNLGLVYRSQGKLAEALQQFNAVQTLDPSDAYTAYFVAAILFQQGDYAAAADSYLKAIDLDPALLSAYFGASRAYTALQQPDRAQPYQDRFQALTQGSALNATVGNQYGEQGPYALAETTDSLGDGPATAIDVRFTDISNASGIASSGGVACLIDVNRDGLPDLFVGDTLYRNRGNRRPRFEKVATLQRALGCTVGDFDNDDYPDLFITTATDGILYRNDKGRLVQSTIGSTGTAPGVAFADLDHDGWLDLMVGARAFRNKADGTFSEVAMPQTGGVPTAVIPTDHDNDRDIDALLAVPNVNLMILSNNRDGSFTRKDILPEMTRNSFSATVVDFDKDSWMDILLARTGQPPLLLRNSPTQRFAPVSLPLPPGVIGERGVAAFDFDNDGFMDLAFIAKEGNRFDVRLLRNLGSNRFEDVTERTQLNRIAFNDPQNILAFDADDDGDSDLVITQNGGPPVVLRNDGGNKNHALRVTLKGFKDNKTAIGTKVEIHGGDIRQKVEVATPGPILFGTGKSRADFVRMLWPTGVVQDEIPGDRTRVAYVELDRKGSSCPTLYSWDGSRFRFITDVIGPGVIGEWESPGEWNASDTDEYVRLNASDAALIDGKYRFKILSQMEEVTYLDALKMVAVDTPADVGVYPNDRYQPIPPYPEFKLWQTRGAHKPVSVVDDEGHDLSQAVAQIDGIYAPVPKIPNYPGFARMHSIIIDVGELPSSGTAQLVFRGYTEYFDSTTAHSAYSSRIEPVIPYVEVADGKGEWIRRIESMGLPAGLPKSIVVDLTGMFPTADHRVRITNNMEIYWDQILVNTYEGGGPIHVTTLAPEKATLAFAGYPLELRKRPEDYDYRRLSRHDAFQFHRGNYTRYGDVAPLMKSADDMFAIMATGDEITADFNAAQLPALPPGWHRTLLVYADGYEKAMETYTPFPGTVGPLPFHKMTKFPYPATEHYPDDAEHVRYQLEYNTRHIDSAAPAQPQYRRQEH